MDSEAEDDDDAYDSTETSEGGEVPTLRLGNTGGAEAGSNGAGAPTDGSSAPLHTLATTEHATTMDAQANVYMTGTP